MDCIFAVIQANQNNALYSYLLLTVTEYIYICMNRINVYVQYLMQITTTSYYNKKHGLIYDEFRK